MTTDITHWTAVCAATDILPDTGVCALVDGVHVAIFHVGAAERFFAIDNVDPRSQASVLSRGLVGNLGDRIVVASPLYKNHFDLTSGECLEAPEHSVRAHAVRIDQGRVHVAVALPPPVRAEPVEAVPPTVRAEPVEAVRRASTSSA